MNFFIRQFSSFPNQCCLLSLCVIKNFSVYLSSSIGWYVTSIDSVFNICSAYFSNYMEPVWHRWGPMCIHASVLYLWTFQFIPLPGWRWLLCRTERSDGAFPCKSHVCCRFVYGQCENGVPSSVSIAADFGLDSPWSNPGGDEIFCLSRPALGPTRPPVKWVLDLSWG